MGAIFETVMLVCFGLSWPINVVSLSKVAISTESIMSWREALRAMRSRVRTLPIVSFTGV